MLKVLVFAHRFGMSSSMPSETSNPTAKINQYLFGLSYCNLLICVIVLSHFWLSSSMPSETTNPHAKINQH